MKSTLGRTVDFGLPTVEPGAAVAHDPFNEVSAREYCAALGIDSFSRDVETHIRELHALVSALPDELRKLWPLAELMKLRTEAHFRMTDAQQQRVQRILDGAKDTAFAKAMTPFGLENSSTLRWWIHAHSRGV
jgi:hypothetical protein